MPVQLDERLSCAAALFPACVYGADIGADHGRLSCYLLESGKCQRMCVSDISADSLKKARELLTQRGLLPRADLAVGDGLLTLPHPAQAIAILGMGGHTLAGILQTGKAALAGAQLILSPHTETALVRKTLSETDYRIEEEKIVRANGRLYTVLRAAPGTEPLSPRQCFLGPRLMESAEPLYPDYLTWQMGLAAVKRTDRGRQEYLWLKEEYHRVCNCENR